MIAFLRRLFCRHTEQSDPFDVRGITYFECLTCGKHINVDSHFKDEP